MGKYTPPEQDTKKTFEVGPRRKPKLLWIFVLAAVFMAGGGGYFAYKSMQNPEPDQQADAKVVTASYDKINSKDYKGASEALTKQIEGNIKNDQQRYEAYANLGSAYLGQQQPDKALEALLQAEAIKKQETAAIISSYIARLYARKGDKETAISYYRKAIARIKATPETADDGYISDYEGAIQQLGGSL